MPPPPQAALLEEALESVGRLRSQPSHQELYAMFPYHKPQIDAFKTFELAIRADLPPKFGTYSKETCDIVNAKFRDMIDHWEYSFKPMQYVREQLELEANYAWEKLMFLHEEKIDTTLAEHPDWAEEIRRRIYNLEYYPPFEGTPLEELYS
jgi:hypothetical protein